MILVYTATNKVNGKKYIGVTKDFKRRMNEHKRSPYPFGKAIREFGIHSFSFEFEEHPDYESAYAREAELVTEDVIRSDDYYNFALGGKKSAMRGRDNPMYYEGVLENHPSLFTSDNNPIKDPSIKKKMIASQKCRKVSVEGKVYYGVREAARKLGVSRQFLLYRLKSDSFPTYFYL